MRAHPLQQSLLDQDVAGIQAFLNDFDPPANGELREVETNSTGELVIIRNMPLPDGFKPDYIDLLIMVPDYPSRPPIGIYLLERSNQELIQQLRRIFNVMNRPAYSADAVDGYAWICLHYANDTWKYNRGHFSRGDNLRKFVVHFYNRCQLDART